MSTTDSSPDRLFELTRGGVSDATLEMWVRTVHAGLPNNEDQASREALAELVRWMVKYTPSVIRKLAAHFHVPRPVVDDMLKDLPHITQTFLTCPASGHFSASPGVTAYLRYAETTRASGITPRGFWEWCFFGTRTRLYSFLKQTAKTAYGAPAELFRARESGQKARRRMVQSGQLVEYLRLRRAPDDAEVWTHRHLHPEGHRPPNAVPSTERRFLTRSTAQRYLEFTLTDEHQERERRLLEQFEGSKGVFQIRFLGEESNPALLLWLFEQLHEPFPLLSTTLDALFAASVRFRDVSPDAV